MYLLRFLHPVTGGATDGPDLNCGTHIAIRVHEFSRSFYPVTGGATNGPTPNCGSHIVIYASEFVRSLRLVAPPTAQTLTADCTLSFTLRIFLFNLE